MLKLFIKGFLVGLGKIIPGVSGSMLAISFGIYDRILEIISHFFKNIKNNISFLLPICFGFIVAVISSSNLLYYLINNYYVIMMFIFIGLILSGLPDLKSKIEFNCRNIVVMIISFLIIFLLSFINSNDNNTKDYSIFRMFLIGNLEAFTTIVPGISGTAIMMLIGCYNMVLKMFSNLFSINYLKYTIPFFIGIIVGAIIISKIISYLLKKYKSQTFASILGFMGASLLLLIIKLIPNIHNILEVIIGLILMFISMKLASKLNM